MKAVSTWQFGRLTIGDIPRVVGTISQAATLLSVAQGGAVPCDVVEVRLDNIGIGYVPEWMAKCKAIEARGWPVIFTLRLAVEGGTWRRPDETRINFFTTALEHLSAVDVELQSPLVPKLAGLARAKKKALIVSYHDFVKTPPLRSLQDRVTEAGRYASVVKITTMVTKPDDVVTLRRLLEQDWRVPLCVMGMGATGMVTRTLFPTLGSCLTYGYLDAAAAPGQLAAAELVQQLAAVLPEYRQRHQQEA
jgi:3-dehydroquinate dehydratase-1